jgi:hypothetical protein
MRRAEMPMMPTRAVERATCLNCGAELRGRFCGECGQRVVPPYPTLREMAGDAWEELSGYDGRFARTFRMLLRHPGRLTLDVLEGRRARYITPVRLYLVASVLYFVVAAAAPNARVPQASMPTKDGMMTIGLFDPQGGAGMTAEQRAAALEQLDRAPAWARAVMRPVILDPVGFRGRMMVNLLFERRRRFLQHLVFALHLHAAVFLALTVARLSHFGGVPVIALVCDGLAAAFVVGYTVIAFRAVYGDRWLWLAAKLVAIGLMYAVAGAIALTAAVTWTAVVSAAP